MRCNISRSSLELTWKLSACCHWLSCREVAKLTGSAIQTSANHRALADRIRAPFPRMKLYRLELRIARQIDREIAKRL